MQAPNPTANFVLEPTAKMVPIERELNWTYNDDFHAVLIGKQLLGLLLVDDLSDLPIGRVPTAAAGAAVLRLGREEVVALDARLVRHQMLELAHRIAHNLKGKKRVCLFLLKATFFKVDSTTFRVSIVTNQ